MSRSLAFLAACIALVGVLETSAQVPAQEESIKVSTLLVSVPTIVSDRNGRYVPNLTQKDFTLFQDGQQQSIEFFAATEEPINVALLIDTSQSTRGVLDDIKDSARSFIKLLTPKDKAMIVSFDYDTHILSGLTSDHGQLKRAIDAAEIPDRGLVGTTLRDAVYQTINQTFAPLKGRKAIILLTDGKDAGSRVRQDELLYSLQESDTLIYTVMFATNDFAPGQGGRNQFPGGMGRGGIFDMRFPDPRMEQRRRQQEQRRQQQQQRQGRQNEIAQNFLNQLSEITAGRAYSSKDGKVKTTFASIVEELRYQYRLGFYPPEEAEGQPLHQIRVKVNRTDAVVRARGSYRTVSR